jgi:hypothetical protein
LAISMPRHVVSASSQIAKRRFQNRGVTPLVKLGFNYSMTAVANFDNV